MEDNKNSDTVSKIIGTLFSIYNEIKLHVKANNDGLDMKVQHKKTSVSYTKNGSNVPMLEIKHNDDE